MPSYARLDATSAWVRRDDGAAIPDDPDNLDWPLFVEANKL